MLLFYPIIDSHHTLVHTDIVIPSFFASRRLKSLPLLPLLLLIGLLAVIPLTVLLSSTSRDFRNRASTDSTNPEITLTVSPAAPVKNQVVTVTFNINTKAKTISGIQLLNFLIVPDGDLKFKSTPVLETIPVSGLQEFTKSVLQNSPVNDQITALTHISILASPTVGYTSANQTVPFAKVTFTPDRPGTIQFNFNGSNTKVTEFGGTATDILTPPVNRTITIADNPTGTIDPTPTLASCNQRCDKNSDCKSGLYCHNGYCRNGSCNEETDCDCTVAKIYKTCNQSCSSHADCGTGLYCSPEKVCRDYMCPQQMNCDCVPGSNTGGLQATATPTKTPTRKPTLTPTRKATLSPTDEPTLTATPSLTNAPTRRPLAIPTPETSRFSPQKAIVIFLIPALVIVFIVIGLYLFKNRDQESGL